MSGEPVALLAEAAVATFAAWSHCAWPMNHVGARQVTEDLGWVVDPADPELFNCVPGVEDRGGYFLFDDAGRLTRMHVCLSRDTDPPDADAARAVHHGALDAAVDDLTRRYGAPETGERGLVRHAEWTLPGKLRIRIWAAPTMLICDVYSPTYAAWEESIQDWEDDPDDEW